jgi:hypothetical protein
VRQAQRQEEQQLDSSPVGQEGNELKNSRNLLESSLLSYRQVISNNINPDQEKLLDKLKQAEKMIEVQKEMEERIIIEYRSNVDRLKTEIRDKNRLIESSN